MPRLTLGFKNSIACHPYQVGESGKYLEYEETATEGATAPETLRSTDRLVVKTLESGCLLISRRVNAPPTE